MVRLELDMKKTSLPLKIIPTTSIPDVCEKKIKSVLNEFGLKRTSGLSSNN